MNIIYRTEFGSKIYGTSLPSSDTDIKGVYIPSAQDILLQRVKKSVNYNTKTDGTAKNTAADVDDELMSLQQFLRLISEGQTPALDMLFAPRVSWQGYAPAWLDVLEHKEAFLTRKIGAAVGYIATQANKYGIKGSRMGAVADAIEFFTKVKGDLMTLRDVAPQLSLWMVGREYIRFETIEGKQGPESYFHIVGKNYPMHLKIGKMLIAMSAIYAAYGHRAEQAKNNEGVDWKALYHAVRVGREAEELLLYRTITFPRPEAKLLLEIRQGLMPYAQVADIIEAGIENVKAAQAKSTLRDEPDLALIDSLVVKHYGAAVRNA